MYITYPTGHFLCKARCAEYEDKDDDEAQQGRNKHGGREHVSVADLNLLRDDCLCLEKTCGAFLY